MGIFEIEQKARKEGWNMHIPKGKGLREGIQYCAHQGKKLGSSGLHINKTDAGLKAIIFKSPAKPSAKPSARPSHPTSSKPSETKSKKFCKFIDKENDVQCIKVPQGGCNGYCWTQYERLYIFGKLRYQIK